MSFTLNDFICNCGFSNLKPLTCQEKLDNPVTGVNVIDNPDVASWVKPGEMVLTTGYFFANDPNLQTNVIMNLRACGCSALCIKIRRFFPEVPEKIIKTAEQAGLPVIDVPLEYSFSELTQKIHERLNHQKLQDLQREQLLFNSLINTLHSEHSLQTCLKLISDYISASLFIVNSRLQCMFFYIRPQDRGLFASSDVLEIETMGNSRPSLDQTATNHAALKINAQNVDAVLLPFRDNGLFLCIPRASFPASPDFIQRAMKLLRFPQERLSRTPTNFSEYYNDFFHLLLSSGQKRADVDKICEYYGYPHSKAQLCVLFSLRSKEEEYRLQPPIAFLKEVLHELACRPSSYFLASYQRQICLFLLAEKNSAQLARRCADAFQKRYGASFTAGASQLVWGDRKLIPAYQQASFLLSLGDIFPTKNSFFFNDYLLFWNIREMPPENKYKIFEDTVKPLVDYDTKNNADLLKTLLQYFDAQFNASLAAKQLYIHRNTFLKRLSKIGELISFNPEDINSLLSLYYGICVYLMERY